VEAGPLLKSEGGERKKKIGTLLDPKFNLKWKDGQFKRLPLTTGLGGERKRLCISVVRNINDTDLGSGKKEGKKAKG